MLFVLKYTLQYINIPSSDEAKKVRNIVPVLGMATSHLISTAKTCLSFSQNGHSDHYTICLIKKGKGTFYLAVVYDCDEDKLQ